MSFIFNGISSDSKGFNVTERQVYNAPAFDVNAIEVPGRSGDVLNLQNRFKNKTVTYKGFMRTSDFAGATKREKISAGTRALKAWLLADTGYKDLVDGYDPGFIRRGYVAGETAIKEILDRPDGVELTITFNCEPFMRVVEDPITVTSTGSVTNDFAFEALPKLVITTINGTTHSIIVNGETWTLEFQTAARIVCDAEAMEWYRINSLGNPNLLVNQYVTGPKPFPTIAANGTTTFEVSTGVSQIEIYPNRRTL